MSAKFGKSLRSASWVFFSLAVAMTGAAIAPPGSRLLVAVAIAAVISISSRATSANRQTELKWRRARRGSPLKSLTPGWTILPILAALVVLLAIFMIGRGDYVGAPPTTSPDPRATVTVTVTAPPVASPAAHAADRSSPSEVSLSVLLGVAAAVFAAIGAMMQGVGALMQAVSARRTVNNGKEDTSQPFGRYL
ncbi:hypothetical protein F5972_06365 [Microbispora cellulosiformans]|uniref:Uncharacterized protein n=1 Tax=Microbispora cellulosiformans TaxID=2614688 RepID=A0A5J5K7J9_9ACTN|nr:hypothetical protein [Microbispora cellulosiformans]KAA9380730.1 hypothetical protein F5972_06365 [Microbispora cellulosiformans]